MPSKSIHIVTNRKRRSASPTIREMESKPQGDITLHLYGWILSERKEVTSDSVNVGNREFCCAASEYGDWCNNYGNSVEVPQKHKDSAAIPILGIYLQEMKTGYGRIIRTPRSCCVMHNRQEMETYFPGDEWIKKMWHVYTYNIPLPSMELQWVGHNSVTKHTAHVCRYYKDTHNVEHIHNI